MKKIIFLIGTLMISLVLFSGCQATDQKEEQDSQNISYDIEAYQSKLADNRKSITACKDAYADDIAAIQNSQYGNLHFDSCDFGTFPQVDVLEVLTAKEHGISTEESWDTIQSWLEDIGKSDVIDMKKDVYVVSEQLGLDEDGNYFLFYDHLSDLDSGAGAFIHSNACHIQMGGNGIYSMSDGKITEYLGLTTDSDEDAFGYHAEQVVESGKVSELADLEYELTDGTLSVQTGADLVKAYFEAGTPFPCVDEINVDVNEVNVFHLKDVYGYDYKVRRMYRGVPFAAMDLGNIQVDGKFLPAADIKHAYVIDQNGVAAFCGYNESEILETLISEENMLGAKDAVDLMSEGLASYLDIQVENMELVYMPFDDSMSEGEEERIIFPCWEIRGLNLTKDEQINIYVDVLTGDINYYTRRE